mmetsp:Transcript_13596/g.29944  ORF Transcript_13596/g.29944 Transcript_13596/m.29944 type:complete len:235 (-) Transcript_13596:109-813(-)|eukprot:CAMPEP_0170606224 /NCGR_PEP_ID=MMETSP0224-20130122/20396_1 /TAXON_ID=285029 /ORGANISM="Togula jolla, Strain CCCM 725" /LENGTH=234 /DNA_ID=CAMNT_0010931287 /DNA_START=102 /DNA_END=806 /DNA_ORIENTATION=+
MAGNEAPAGDSTWLVDMIVGFMHSPSWREPLSAFVNEKCTSFDNFQEENKHEYVEVHKEFKSLVDDLLTAHLLEVDMMPEDFEKQCMEAGLQNDPRLQQVVSQLAAAEDFVSFKNMMVQHHIDQQRAAEETFKELSSEDTAAREAAEIAAALKASSEATEAQASPARAQAASQAASSTGLAVAVPAPTAAEERAFGAAGGAYGRAAMPSGQRKPQCTEKASAIRKALCSALKPK